MEEGECYDDRGTLTLSPNELIVVEIFSLAEHQCFRDNECAIGGNGVHQQ